MKDLPSQSTASAQPPPPVPPKSTSLASAVPFPEQLECGECKTIKPPKDFWWCRTCQKTVCSCNLIQGHTEHRTAPWRPDELVRSLIDCIECRCNARMHRAAEEETSVREYAKEIEKYFLSKLHSQLDEKNEEDRSLLTVVCAATGINSSERKLWPPASHSPIHSANSATPNLLTFDLLTDDNVARLVNDLGRLLPPDCARTLTVTKSPRNSAASSPLLGSERRSVSLAKSNQKSGSEDPLRSFKYTRFPAVLPDVDPVQFARLLEQHDSEVTPRIRSRSQSSSRNQGRSTTPFLEHVSSRAGSPASGRNGNTLSIYGSMDVDVNGSGGTSPIPKDDAVGADGVRLRTRAIIHDQKEPSLVIPDDQEGSSSVQLMISEHTQTSSSSLTSSTQTEIIGNGGTPVTSTPITPSTPINGSNSQENTRDLAETSTGSTKSNCDDSSMGRSLSITAFHFGDDYFTRPIDIRPLPERRLAISDSCGGVYITNANGEVLHQVWLDGFSASSLCYLPGIRPANDDRYPPMLLVSVLRKQNRCVNFYDARDFSLLDTVACPRDPQVDLGRSRWLAADDRGALFMVSGDGKVSALWKYYPATKGWTLLKQAPKSRYQYLDVVHTMTDPASVTLLTCDGLRGSLLLITISRATSSNGYNKILAEEDFSQTYQLGRFIRSPASAVVDHQGNMLILDYASGKLWLLKAPTSTPGSSGTDDKDTTDRRLKILTEIGPQQAVGLAVTSVWNGYGPYGDHWCYVACYNKKRVHAVKYLSD